jgi:hypothetical protein
MTSHRFEGFTPIDSGHLDGAKYDPIGKKLTVRFKNGYTYDVHGVSAQDHQDFMEAPSQGEHFHQVIKNNYRVERVK